MLKPSDYELLKASVKGWDRAKLAKYGIEWPPLHGWRKKLLREFEGFNDAAEHDRSVTAEWYKRISGQIPWKPGEQEMYRRKFDAEWFATLKSE